MIRIRCFGGISVEDPDEETVYFRSRKHVALLAYLASNRNRVHPRDQLVRLLWDSPLPSARHSLSQALYDLKRRLGTLSVSRFGDGLRLASEVEFEGGQFEEAVKAGDLRTAVELYRGEFAAAYDSVGTEEFVRWIDDERRRYRILAQAALHKYVEQCDGRGDWGQMCVAALKLVDIDALSESAHRSLMRALWLHGDQASALRHYNEMREQLSRDLPEGISAETQELVRRIRSSAPPVPASIARSEPPVVGREEEFARLREVLAATHQGNGTLVVVRGEAGIGKTRLTAELARCASVEGARLLRSRCYAAEENVAYGPVVDALCELGEERPGRPSGPEGPRYPHIEQLLRREHDTERQVDLEADLAGEKRRFYEEVVSLTLRLCDSSTTVWVVDDVHWIDGSSASLLSYLARRLEDHRFLLVVTVRDEAELSEPCRKLLRERSTDQQATTVSLGPLSPGAVRSLIGTVEEADPVDELARRIHRLSGGNPFLVLEFLRDGGALTSLEAEKTNGEALLSHRVRALLQARLQGLAPPAIRLLEAIAVLGRNATPTHAAHAAGLTLQEASAVSEELYARGILRDEEDRLEFAHDISREFVYRNLGGVRRVSLHLFVAEALASDAYATLPTIARHFHLGGDRARAFEYAIRAATASIASFGHQEAKAMAALALAQAAGDTERHKALDILGRSALALGQLGEAERHFEAILSLATEVSPVDRVQAQLLQGRVKLESSDWEGARRAIQAADISSLKAPNERLEAELYSLSLLLKGAMRQLDAPLSLRIIKEIRERHSLGEREGILTSVAAANAFYSMAAYAAFFESVTEADRLVQKASGFFSEVPDDLAVRILLLRGVVKSHRALWDEAIVFFRQALSKAQETNQVFETGIAWNNLAYCANEQALWAQAEDCCRASMRTFRQLPPSTYVTVTPLTNLGDAFFFQGFVRKAVPIYKRALRETRPDLRPQMLASLGLAALQLGDNDAATRHLAALRSLESAELTRAQERFKIAWLCAYTARSSPEDVRRILHEAAEAQRDINVASYLKLLWLERLLLGTRDVNQKAELGKDVIARLRDARLGWFARFSKRWLVAADANKSDLRRHA